MQLLLAACRSRRARTGVVQQLTSSSLDVPVLVPLSSAERARTVTDDQTPLAVCEVGSRANAGMRGGTDELRFRAGSSNDAHGRGELILLTRLAGPSGGWAAQGRLQVLVGAGLLSSDERRGLAGAAGGHGSRDGRWTSGAGSLRTTTSARRQPAGRFAHACHAGRHSPHRALHGQHERGRRFLALRRAARGVLLMSSGRGGRTGCARGGGG